jgi:hypothetical protein
MLIFLFSIILLIISNQTVFASTNTTLIINQVRGNECCSVGKISNFQLQLDTAQKLNLPSTFALRYDVLKNQEFLNLIKNYQNDSLFEWGAFLEITPQLAKDAGVAYSGNENNWYEAQFAYLIGYSQADREKLLATYMERFENIFGEYPKSSTAWMIDPFSLQLLKNKYGVLIHQITREQMGVDSYTLYGGPAHYPYYPSDNWALVPASGEISTQMPIMVRQTITDPVYNYGDDSSSFTSQANDYALRQANFDYFEHLFLQAHTQNPDQDTFALVGLENSMPSEVQAEFVKQLQFVKNWQKEDQNRQVLKAADFAQFFQTKNKQNPELSVYGGSDQNDLSEKAWWITTPFYRLRLRLSDKELFISDLRVYDNSFTDPYTKQIAKKLGWWIVPFIIDGSRYPANDQSRSFDLLVNDNLSELKNADLKPTRLILSEKIESKDLKIEINAKEFKLIDLNKNLILAVLDEQKITLNKEYLDQTQNALLEQIKKDQPWHLQKIASQDNLDVFKIQIRDQANLLEQIRQEHYPLLFPELSEHPLDSQNTYLYKNNRFALAGRNPVRLVLFPRDQYGYPINLKTEPKISSQNKIDSIEVKAQSGYSGMLFLDFNNAEPLQSQVTIEKDGFAETVNIYFAPNCKSNPKYCLTHPQQALWYLASTVGDKWRDLREKMKNL